MKFCLLVLFLNILNIGYYILSLLIMCPHKNLFSSYEKVNGGIFLMGNNISHKIIGLGSVKVKIFDGIIRTLTKVRHVECQKCPRVL